jgi:hypothetical protein
LGALSCAVFLGKLSIVRPLQLTANVLLHACVFCIFTNNTSQTLLQMIFSKNFIITVSLTCFTIAGCAQTQISIPKEFIETNPPKPESKEWFSLNYSTNEFGVSIIEGKLNIKKTKEIDKCELKITGGTLVGIDNGEWGGHLTFKPSNLENKAIDIKSGNIKTIFKFKGKVYFIEGLAHMSYSGGSLYSLDTANYKFKCTKLIDFDDAPQAFTIYNDKMFIATFQNFYVVQNFKKELIFKETFWRSLYPNSIAAFDDKNAFIGIRGGIVKLDLINKTLKFYKYKE